MREITIAGVWLTVFIGSLIYSTSLVSKREDFLGLMIHVVASLLIVRWFFSTIRHAGWWRSLAAFTLSSVVGNLIFGEGLRLRIATGTALPHLSSGTVPDLWLYGALLAMAVLHLLYGRLYPPSPLDPNFHRGIVAGETVEGSVEKVVGVLNGTHITFIAFRSDQAMLIITEHLREELEHHGAKVYSLLSGENPDFQIYFNMKKGPEFEFEDKKDGRKMTFSPVQWPLNGRSIKQAMKADIAAQCLYHFSVFVKGRKSESNAENDEKKETQPSDS